jgi:hypothetical protein
MSSVPRSLRLAPALALLALAAAPLTTRADPSDWHATLGAGTDAPLSIGGRLTIEGPLRLRLSSSVGYLPGVYVDTINDAAVRWGAYDATTGDVVRSSIERSLVWRTHLGVRLWRGLHLEAGYGRVSLSGSVRGDELLRLVTGTSIPATELGRSFHVAATLHMLDVELGYDFGLPAGFRLRVAVGGAFAVSAPTRVTSDHDPATRALLAPFEQEAERRLEDELRRYGMTPTVSLSLGYQLF